MLQSVYQLEEIIPANIFREKTGINKVVNEDSFLGKFQDCVGLSDIEIAYLENTVSFAKLELDNVSVIQFLEDLCLMEKKGCVMIPCGHAVFADQLNSKFLGSIPGF